MENPKALLIWLAASLLIGSCKKEEPEAVDLGYGYFPRTVGAWIDYEVDSIVRDDEFNVLDTLHYEMREKVVEAYIDPAGRTAWRVHRFVRDNGGNWIPRDVWTSTTDANYAEVTEENMRRLKLSFPVREGRAWNMNVYCGQQGAESIFNEQVFELAYEQTDAPWSVNGLAFDRTALVHSTVESNFIDSVVYSERYANGLGLVHRYLRETNRQPYYNPDSPYQLLGYQTKGIYFEMTVTAFGQD